MDWTEAPALRRKLPANGHSPEPTATAPVADSTRRTLTRRQQPGAAGPCASPCNMLKGASP
jgi:hypothetical protein